MLEVKKNENLNNDYQIDSEFALFYNGDAVKKILVEKDDYYETTDENFFKVETQFNYETDFLMEFNFDDLSSFTSELILRDWKIEEDFEWSIKIYFRHGLNIIFSFSPDIAYWKKSYSFAEYKNTFNQIVIDKYSSKLKPEFIMYPEEFSDIELSARYNCTSNSFGNDSIKVELNNYKNLFAEVHKEVLDFLKIHGSNNSIYVSLDFPEEVKIPCEQYLLYFVKFLRDLGIYATSNLKEEAGKVLFSVTPTDDIEALDKIREALAIYLHLPSSPIIYDDSFASMRQKQQIDNLQHSQRIIEMEFRLSQKVIASQDKIILQKDSLIEQQNKIIEKISSKSIMLDSVENREELEEIYDGLKIGESKTLKEWLGIHLNPAKINKTSVKNVFGKEETKSVLGLNEETNRENN